MASNIKITPNELTAQAVKLETLDNQLGEAMAKSDQAFRLLCDALSAAFTPNMRTKATKLMRNMETLRRSIHTGADVARECAASYENADKVLRDKIGDELPASIQVLPTSEQTVEKPIDESIYDQTAYSQFMEHYDYDYDGDVDYINTGCVITSCAYALTRMGIPTTPLQAYERSGGCGAVYNAISQNQAYIRMNQPVSLLDEMAKKAKTDPNMSPLMLRVNGNTHTVVLKDIELDANGNITKYIVFDPYKAQTKEYTAISQMKVSKFNYYVRA